MRTGAEGREPSAFGRYAATVLISLLLHAAALALLAPWAGAAPPAAADELLVPLRLAAPAEEPEPDDRRLLGFRSEGEIEGEPDRPQLPPSEIPGAPPPPETPSTPEPEPPEESPAPAPPAEAARPPDRAEPQPLPENREESPERAPAEAAESAQREPEPSPAGSEPEELPREEEAPPTGLPPEPAAPPASTAPGPSAPAPVRPPPVPDLDIPFEGGLAGGDLRFDSPDYDWSDYATKLYFAIYRAWLRELDSHLMRIARDQRLAGGGGEIAFDTVVHFIIERKGAIGGIEVLVPSANRSGDDAATSALRRAVVPPLPDDFPRDREGVTAVFRVRADDIRQIERWLRRLKRMGRL
ncbi:MAG: hypothetical protein D6718_08750 [Acidobacteria bacterium]|nr:MAG: hypothetical protein D6718_08750 [Acidobacteriota bacterium]